MSTFRKVTLYCLYIIAVGVLAGVIVKSFYPSNSKTDTSSKSSTQSKHQAIATTKPKTVAAKSSSPKKTTGVTTTTPKTTAGAAVTAAPPTTLENTGPGNLVGLFAVAFAAGTFGYHTYLRNRRADRLS